ncbi:hypothetical protein [Mycobacterium bourgelatii]|uniref:Uncharacterized protein n=1 Tax=Mycobacterium bourgelatii TaxID=1273442 RepID=A0A7I9YKI9_MYCBU|nr:hypothetical protein [Mycobacterium bourgelatii]MCV6976875.1 hypothetical protein [Mycobacterium bourgelatii]GFG89205.1 hypothetical protein MBOU_12470 [Mycobacterium bourgelatii]
MQPIDSPARVRSAITDALFNRPRAVLVDGRSEQQFVEMVFPGLGNDTPLYVCSDETVTGLPGIRPGSPPPAFNLFQRLVHPNYPLLAIFITEGVGSVESTLLDEQLLDYYSAAYGRRSDAPERPQSLMNSLAFLEPNAVVDTGEVSPGVGLVVPQVASAPPVVYRLGPQFGSDNSYGPHAFIRYLKFIVPRQDPQTIDLLTSRDFARWTPQ